MWLLDIKFKFRTQSKNGKLCDSFITEKYLKALFFFLNVLLWRDEYKTSRKNYIQLRVDVQYNLQISCFYTLFFSSVCV